VKAESDKPLPVSYAGSNWGRKNGIARANTPTKAPESLWNSLAGTRLASAGRDRTYVKHVFEREQSRLACCCYSRRGEEPGVAR